VLDKHFIQSLAISWAHEDYCGLFELPAAIRERFPGHTEAEILESCREAVSELLKRRLLVLFSVPYEAIGPSQETCRAVEPDAENSVIRAAEPWQLPHEGSPVYWFATTEAGDAAYMSGEFLSL
jgi:hypothetical protein